MKSAQRAEGMDLLPAFEVRSGDHVFKVYANGRTEGFAEFGEPLVINRIPVLLARACAEAEGHE